MINTSKFAFIAAVALASIASPAFSQTATTTHYGRFNGPDRPVYPYAPNAHVDPSDDPALAGGGSPGYNACTGHARC
jgi:hypothetical protein